MPKLLAVIWTLPNSLLGLGFGMFGLCFGTRVQRHSGCLEFYGGLIRAFLRRVPPGGSSSAMTIGHVIFGQDRRTLDIVREHEQVHVRQYERWGPLFIPAYLACSAWLWIRRCDPYLDNPFEIEAYRISDPRNSMRGDSESPED